MEIVAFGADAEKVDVEFAADLSNVLVVCGCRGGKLFAYAFAAAVDLVDDAGFGIPQFDEPYVW